MKANQKLTSKIETRNQLDQAKLSTKKVTERKKQSIDEIEQTGTSVVSLAVVDSNILPEHKLEDKLVQSSLAPTPLTPTPLPGRSRNESPSPSPGISRSNSQTRSRGSSPVSSPRGVSSPRAIRGGKRSEVDFGKTRFSACCMHRYVLIITFIFKTLEAKEVSISTEEDQILKAEICLEQSIGQTEEVLTQQEISGDVVENEFEKPVAEEIDQNEEIRTNEKAIGNVEC